MSLVTDSKIKLMITVKVKENNWYELTVDSWIRRFIGLAPKTMMIKHLDGLVFIHTGTRGVYMDDKGKILNPFDKRVKILDDYRRFLLYK